MMALGVTIFSHAAINTTKADGLVGEPTITWNNIDWSVNSGPAWSGNVDENNVPQDGYCLLPTYPSKLSNTTHTMKNLLEDDLEGSNVGDHILINGEEAKNLDNVIIYCYPENGLFIYIPQTSVTYSEQYQFLTIEVLEGMSIDGSVQTVGTIFEFRGLLGSSGSWIMNPDPVTFIQSEFNSFNWNNIDYSYPLKNKTWSGELNPVGSPEAGYCLLAFFNESGKSYTDLSFLGGSNIFTSDRGIINRGSNIDTKIKINGVNIIDVPGALCYIYPKYGIYFYVPDASLTNRDQYVYPYISIESGALINNVYLPRINFEFRGELGEPNCWVYIKDPSEYKSIDFTCVAGGWNNTAADATHNQTILQFGEYGVDYLKADKVSEGTNLVNRYSDCGTKITINGIPLWEIDETSVNYLHGNCYIYIVIPTAALQPSNGYKVTTFHIEKDTVFYDTFLGEVNLYLINDVWVYEKPEIPEDSIFESAVSFSNIFTAEQATLNADKSSLSGSKECSLDSFSALFNYKLETSDSSFVIYAMSKDNQNGLRLVFVNNSISIYDATQDSVLLGSYEFNAFNYDEWYSLLFYTKTIDNKLSICLAIDDITYIHVNNVNVANKNNIGNLFSIHLGNGSASFKNYVVGADIKKPVLTYTGKAVYEVLAGSEVIDFTNKCSAFDAVDGDVSQSIVISWPDDAINGELLNKGNWEVGIIASDKSGNTATIMVTVIVKDNLEVIVTFDGENPTTYRVGDHITYVSAPTKEGQRFIGWYYNDMLWDFENDYVVEDMNLVSRYQETEIKHAVSFTVEGLKGVSAYTLYFEHGITLDLAVFAKDGYSLKAYVNDSEVETITINEDMTVKLVYTAEAKKNKGCGGSINSSIALISIASGAAFILLVFLRKKGGKEHE